MFANELSFNAKSANISCHLAHSASSYASQMPCQSCYGVMKSRGRIWEQHTKHVHQYQLIKGRLLLN